MAAVHAAENGASVTVLEHNDKTGRKICVTGNGRCNLTNIIPKEDAYRGTHPEFVDAILEQYPVKETLLFFDRIGLTFSERDGRVYPRSNQAKCVPELLEQKARSLKVKLKNREHVKDVFQKDGVWNVQTDTWTYECDAVILANGSPASEVEGADDSGWLLAQRLGHRVHKPLPALLGLKCKENGFAGWAGVRAEGIVSLFIDGEKITQEHGELQLTDYGVSGIPVFQLSTYAVRALDEGKKVSLALNFFPEYTFAEADKLITKRRMRFPWLSDAEVLEGMFPDKLVKVFLKQEEPRKAMTAFPLEVTGSTGFAQAQVCSGGVDTGEVDPVTLESRRHKGLYFAGELLDIDGACGGYNLQWAWSTGAVAGTYAAGGRL